MAEYQGIGRWLSGDADPDERPLSGTSGHIPAVIARQTDGRAFATVIAGHERRP